MDDIDLVMNYFTYEKDFVSMADAVEASLKEFKNRKIVSTHFTMTIYKKGTMHLVFNNEDTLRRFNITACIGKNWLPEDYGRKAYCDMTAEEKEVVESFEGKESYNRNLGRIGFTKQVLAIENKSA
jgi:hypothetical protein